VACGTPTDPSSPEALADAISAGDVEKVDQALSAGADPDAAAPSGLPLLASAAARNDASVVAALLAAGAEADRSGPEGITALHAAAQTGALEAIAALVAGGADLDLRSVNGMAAIDHAAALGRADAITALVAAGSEPDRPSGAVTQGHGYPRDTSPAPLAIAARAGHVDAVEALLAAGADVDRASDDGVTALHAAVFAGVPPAVVEALLTNGADPGRRVACSAGCSVPGELTARDWARELGRTTLIPLLAPP
jgi:ankyrin repeat protein